MDSLTPRDVTRREFLHTSVAGAAAMALGGSDTLLAQSDRDAVVGEIARQHDATVQRLREWIALPSNWIADESWHDSLVRLVTQPTINIEGRVGGYSGPGGKTILRIAPSRRSTCAWCRT
ncbi:MAG: hypothetical protein ACRD2N_09830 [Vicinamibacterales bacterium]